MAPETTLNIETFSGGEFSPRVDGRLSLPQYKAGSRTIENLIPLISGGLERRPGTQFLDNATGAAGFDSQNFTSEGSWLIEFEISSGASYVIELSDFKMQFFRDRGRLLHSNANFSPAQVNTNANQFEIDGHGFSHNQRVVFNRNPGATQPTGLIDGNVYVVNLPQALRSIDPVLGVYATEDPGTRKFNLAPEMGPFLVTHRDIGASPVGKPVWVFDVPDDESCRFTLTKGGVVDAAGDGNFDNAIIPSIESRVNTFRLTTTQSTNESTESDGLNITSQGEGGGFFTAYQDPPVTLVTPWTYEEARRLQWSSENDTMFFWLGDEGHPTWELLRFGVSSFVLQRVKFEGGPLGPNSPLGQDTKLLAATVGSPVANAGVLLTCDSDAFRGTDVGQPIRKTWFLDTDGLRHMDMIIERIVDNSASFTIIDQRVNTVTALGVITIETGSFTNPDRVWVVAPKDPDLSLPPELSERILYFAAPGSAGTSLRLSETPDGLDFIALPGQEIGWTVVGAEVLSVDNDDQGSLVAHGFTDGAEWAGIWVDGIPPTGLDVGYAYKIKLSENSPTTRFRFQRMDSSEVPLFDKGSGKMHVSAVTKGLAPVVRARLLRTAVGTQSVDRTEKWRLGRWGGFRGWPSAGAIHNELLIVGGTDTEPTVSWASQLAGLRDFSPDNQVGTDDDPNRNDRIITDASSWAYKLNGGRRIEWIHPSSELLVGTQEPIFSLLGLTPSTVTANLITNRGTSSVRPIVSDSQAIWGSPKSNNIFAAEFSDARNNFIPLNISILSDHIYTNQNRLVQMALQEEPWSLIWSVREDGMLVTCTFDLQQGVQGWARQPIGGSHSFIGFDPLSQTTGLHQRDHAAVRSIASVTSDDGRTQDLYMVVERSKAGSTDQDEFFRSVEVLSTRFGLEENADNAVFVDSASPTLTVDGTADTIQLHDVMNDRECDLWIDAATQKKTTASPTGLLTFPTTATRKVVVGIPYIWKWRSLSIEALLQDIPTLKGTNQKVLSATFYTVNSLGGKYGGSPNDNDEAISEQPFLWAEVDNFPLGSGPALATRGYFVDAYPDNFEKTAEISLEGTGPEPWFLANIILRISFNADSR